jgi:dTDP-4-dehydrorhamnose reductase
MITGGEGTIGSELNFGIKLSKNDLDVTDRNQINRLCNELKPSAILCLSSIDIKGCEADPFKAYTVNVLGVYNLTLECSKRDIPIIILSTGAIFNGFPPKVFLEDDQPNPQNIYGQTKYLSEIIVRESAIKHLIIRTGWLFGGKIKKGFSNFVDSLINGKMANSEVVATHDQIGSPTYIPDLIEKMKHLIEAEKYGTFHVINEGSASAFNIANEAKLLSNGSFTIKKVSILDASDGIKRSQSEALVSKHIKMRPWQESLKEYSTKKINY